MKKQKKTIVRSSGHKLSIALNKQYQKDLYQWTKTQAELLATDIEKIDRKNMIEEILSLGQSQYDKLESYLTILMMHMLKVNFQPRKHTKSWDLTIKNSQFHAKKTLEKNPSLKSKLKIIIPDAYYSARLEAAKKTGLDEDTFPTECPWDVKDLL